MLKETYFHQSVWRKGDENDTNMDAKKDSENISQFNKAEGCTKEGRKKWTIRFVSSAVKADEANVRFYRKDHHSVITNGARKIRFVIEPSNKEPVVSPNSDDLREEDCASKIRVVDERPVDAEKINQLRVKDTNLRKDGSCKIKLVPKVTTIIDEEDERRKPSTNKEAKYIFERIVGYSPLNDKRISICSLPDVMRIYERSATDNKRIYGHTDPEDERIYGHITSDDERIYGRAVPDDERIWKMKFTRTNMENTWGDWGLTFVPHTSSDEERGLKMHFIPLDTSEDTMPLQMRFVDDDNADGWECRLSPRDLPDDDCSWVIRFSVEGSTYDIVLVVYDKRVVYEELWKNLPFRERCAIAHAQAGTRPTWAAVYRSKRR